MPRKTKEKPVAVKPVSVRFNPQTLKDLEEFARENNLRTQTVIQLSVSFGWHVVKTHNGEGVDVQLPRRHDLRIVRPVVGDIWAFGSPTGRPVTITRISFGASGSWGMVNGKLTHLSGPRRRLYVHAKGATAQTVASWLRSWHFVSRANAESLALEEKS